MSAQINKFVSSEIFISDEIKESYKYLLAIFSVFFLLGLSAFCFRLYTTKQKVLGTQSEILPEKRENQSFWEDFLAKNPDYLPGWLEIGRLDKVKEIDPNFSELHP